MAEKGVSSGASRSRRRSETRSSLKRRHPFRGASCSTAVAGRSHASDSCPPADATNPHLRQQIPPLKKRGGFRLRFLRFETEDLSRRYLKPKTGSWGVLETIFPFSLRYTCPLKGSRSTAFCFFTNWRQ